MNTITYRPAHDDDAEQLIALIDLCYREYEGCILDVDAEEPQLRGIASHYEQKGGEFWVAEKGGQIIGSIGYSPNANKIELKHLYVNSAARRQGLATNLCLLVEKAAAAANVEKIILWTDTRFQDAHRLYERRGYSKGKESRTLQDLSNTTEYYFEKALRSV